MKPVVADYKYRVYCLRIVPLWGDPVYLTDHVRDLEMNGNVYKSDSGYAFSGLPAESNMSPGVLDLTGVANVAGIEYNKVVSGVFDGARVYAFATTWRTPTEDEEPLGLAFCGKTTLKDDRYVIELMMLVDALNQTVGKTYTPSCPKKFGGQEFAGCMVDLAPITVTGTITSVTSNSIFRDNTRTEVADYFGEGVISFTTGANAGLKPMPIKSYTGNKSHSITAITKATNAVITVTGHTFIVGEAVLITGVVGMTQINNQTGTIIAVAANTITVNINSGAYSTYSSGGTAATLSGTVALHDSFHYPVQVGDAYEMIPGCRKRLEDCRDKWNNVINFGGFSFVPTQSTYSQVGGTSS